MPYSFFFLRNICLILLVVTFKGDQQMWGSDFELLCAMRTACIGSEWNKRMCCCLGCTGLVLHTVKGCTHIVMRIYIHSKAGQGLSLQISCLPNLVFLSYTSELQEIQIVLKKMLHQDMQLFPRNINEQWLYSIDHSPHGMTVLGFLRAKNQEVNAAESRVRVEDLILCR